jgi:nicotinate-nucleotide adenylyltransferase
MNKKSLEKIGLFGGTFDPIHIGHLITIQYVLEKRKLDKVIFIPCNISPHKTNRNSSSPSHRLNMVKLAISNFPKFEFSDYEIKKGGVSYSIDTVNYFKKSFSKIELIIGNDNFNVFNKWHNPEEIIKQCTIIVMKRKEDAVIKKNKYLNSVIILDTPTIDISSTEIRNRIFNGKSIDFFVPHNVSQYIKENHLYR